MRYLVVCVLAGLVAWPQSVAAQRGEEARANAGSAIHVQHRLPPQLMLRASYFYLPEHLERRRPGHKYRKTAPEPPSEPESKFSLEYREQKGPEVEEMEERVWRAKTAFVASAVAYGAGAVLLLVGAVVAFNESPILGEPETGADRAEAVAIAGAVLGGAGFVGVVTAGGIWGHRKRELRRLREAHYRSQGRVQWDRARSRLVF